MKFAVSPGASLPRDHFGWMVATWITVLFFWNLRDFIAKTPHDANHLTICFLCMMVATTMVSNNRLTAIIRGIEGKGSNT